MVFCKKNTFHSTREFVTPAIEACCGLHNFLKLKKVGLPPGVADGIDNLAGNNPNFELPANGELAKAKLAEWFGDR